MPARFINAPAPVAAPTAKIREELLELLIQEEVAYPWNPADPGAEDYFNDLDALEEEFDLEDSSLQSEVFFARVDKLCSSRTPKDVRKSLAERFGECVPGDCLDTIAASARTLVATSLSPAEQLVNCVRPFLTHWAEEDLYVFARPLAYAMRCDGQPERQPKAWEELSEIEQARYTMQVACYALQQLESEAPIKN